MKNLVVETQKTIIFKDDVSLLHENYLCCYNIDNNRYYLIDSIENKLLVIDVINGTKYIDQKLYLMNEVAKPVGIEYSTVTQEIYIAYDCGIILCITDLTEEKVKYDEVADITTGLQCMKISPDHEVVVLLTKDNFVITLSINFDILNEAKLSSTEFGEKQFITAGWGKKETQFHGSEGKAAAKAKATVITNAATDNGLPKITWKGDGMLFAISFIDSNVNARRFKVFNREGYLQYTSELVDCLEETLSWKPSGNLIATTRKLPNKHTVAFFEKNGLLHREFSLPFSTKDIKIKNLIWSRDSDVLGVWYKDFDNNTINVQLWSEKNYHWYLKQTITYSKMNPILYITWNSQIDKDLLILSTRNSTIYTFCWTVFHSHGKEISDKAVVGVIDGDKVLVTNFKDSIVPPPMCQQTLQFNEPVNIISYAPSNSNNTNDFLVLLCNNKIVLCKHTNDSWKSQYSHEKTYSIDLPLKVPENYSNHLIHHLLWFKPNIVLCSLSHGANSLLCELNLLDINQVDKILIDAKIIHEMPGQIEHIIPSADSNVAYIIVNNNKLYSYNDRDGLMKSELKITHDSLNRAVVKIEFVKFSKKEVIVALTRKHILYVDGKQVANNVTSFFVHSEFLLITTLHHALICFKLDEHGLSQLCSRDLTIQPWESDSYDLEHTQDISIRRIERGSTLIIAIAKDAKTILQMPRGNLECIQPRGLSLNIIGTLIDNLEYFKAFDLMRKQRIDLNLLHDHNPYLFMSNIEKFVNDINNPNWLSLFLTELKEEDVKKTTYISSYGECKSLESVTRKVESVCKSLRTIMQKNSNVFMQPILTSWVKSKTQNDLENALLIISELKSQEKKEKEGFSAEEALKYLLYLVDVNVLYDVALGMYDFKLVMFIAQKSQKDPKEYISFLNDLNKLEDEYMMFTVDSYLKRYNSALKHISKIPEKFEECLTFIQNHNMYNEGIKLFKAKSPEYKKIAIAYGRFLLTKSKYHEAGIMFTKGEDFEEALVAYKLNNSWRDAIVTGIHLKFSITQMNDLYDYLTKELIHEKRYEEAAVILSKYMNKVEDAILALCEGRKWHQAWTDAYCIDRADLIDKQVKPGVVEHAWFMLSQLQQQKEDFRKYKSRLTVVREEAAARELLSAQYDLEQESGVNRELSDLLSDTTSIAGSTVTRCSKASHTTSKTYRSSKNRRKHERKLQSIKEGSVYEDLALIRALHQLVVQTYALRDEVRSVAEILLYANEDLLAEKLSKMMNEFLTDIRNGKHEIWPPVNENKNLDTSEPNYIVKPNHYNNIPSNLIEPHLLQSPEEKPCNWKLDMFFGT